MEKLDLLELARSQKKVTLRNFLEAIYNNNFRLSTSKISELNSAYNLQEKYPDLMIKIKRLDYSNMHIITILGE